MNEKTKHILQKVIWIGVIAVCTVIVILLIPHMEPFQIAKDHEAPEITGVKDRVVVYEDYTEDEMDEAIKDGVETIDNMDKGRQAPKLSIRVFDEVGTELEGPTYPAGTYRIVYYCQDRNKNEALPVETVLEVRPADHEAPVIEGAHDITVAVNGTVSYRDGVTVTDNVDEEVELRIDSSAVDLTKPGEYPVRYFATDLRGNEASVTITVTVTETVTLPDDVGDVTVTGTAADTANVTLDELNAVTDQVLGKIVTNGMSQKQKAKAIYDYVHNHIKYVGTSDKSSWVNAAYVGFTRGRGDCYNYFACSKALLTRAGIANVDLQRVGGNSRHYWQLVNVGSGYYHFDACPHPNSYPLYSFLLTEAQVRAYTEQCSSVRKNYYVYDYDACPVTVVGTPSSEKPSPSPSLSVSPTPSPSPSLSPSPSPSESPTPVVSPTPTPTGEPSPSPSETGQVTEEPLPTDSSAPEETGGTEASQPPAATDTLEG